MAFMRPTADYFTQSEAWEYTRHDDEQQFNDCEAGWYSRLSAPGYMDATDWIGPYANAETALRAVMDLYEVDENGDTPLLGGYCLLCQRTFDTDRAWSDHAQTCMDRTAES